jgi:hypothetical protein
MLLDRRSVQIVVRGSQIRTLMGTLCAPNRPHLPLLDCSQKFRLQIKRKLTDLCLPPLELAILAWTVGRP